MSGRPIKRTLRVTGLLRGEGWRVNYKRVERLWRREGLKVSQKQPKRGRLWLTDGSCVRYRPAYRLHVWASDFLTARTHDGRPLKILVVVDEYSRECLAIRVARRLRSTEVLETLAELFVTYGLPAHNVEDLSASRDRRAVAARRSPDRERHMSALRSRSLFISHSWSHGNAYEELVALLDAARHFQYQNYSVPKNDPVHNAPSVEALSVAIKKEMLFCNVVLLMAGKDATYNKWILREIKIAKKKTTASPS